MKKLKKTIKYLMMTSWLKTFYFNWKYFGLRGGLPVFVSRNFILKKMGGTVNIVNRKIATVMLGYHDVALFDRKRSKGIWSNDGIVEFIGKDRIGHGCKIAVGNKGSLRFGEDVSINAETEICCQKEVIFGNHNVVSWDCLIMDTDFHSIVDEKNNRINEDCAIHFEDDVWIGCRCIILKGTWICKGCVIAAGSVVPGKKCMIEASIFGFNGKVLREKIRWVD